MTAVSGPTAFSSFRVQKRYGYSNLCGTAHAGYTRAGEEDAAAGIYSIKHSGGKSYISRMRFYWPTNPQTPAQQARRDLFAAGVSAYRALTADELRLYTIRGKQRGLTAYQFFLSRYLSA